MSYGDIAILDTQSGEFMVWDPHNLIGVGMPDGCVELDEASTEQLAAAVPSLLRSVRALEQRVRELESTQPVSTTPGGTPDAS